ncbi:MAG: Zn-dependent hydrolase [Gammaproteobacteria bacterium]|jgi:N-carbamoyl-L-amino-acid hydrolase|nr:Zn-dependent hydrolase [Gammaproteobacteria bacterium]
MDRHLIRKLRIDEARLWSSLMTMAQIGATSHGGCNRQALTDEDKTGRDLFVQWAQAAGCTVTVDAVGNIFAARKGVDPNADPVLMGSHLDTQATGGRFDGVYGVMAGLEVMRVLATHGVDLKRTVEVASWTNEEGCRFAPAMLGSGVVAGAYTQDFAYERIDKSGRSFREELERIGYRGTAPARARPFRAMFEAHIEQGPILENLGATIGVVAGIQGAYWFDVTLEGLACHAGPTPMEMRRDPWRAATTIIESAFAIAKTKAPWGRATIGDLKVSPGARNTVPERLVVAVDLRHPEPDVLEEMVAMFREQVAQTSARTNIDARIEQIWHMPATRFDTELVGVVDRAAQDLGFNRVPIVSGAGHDSLHTAQFAPTAMIFVPCAGGLSHNEAESATSADLAAGANVLLQSVLCVANN